MLRGGHTGDMTWVELRVALAGLLKGKLAIEVMKTVPNTLHPEKNRDETIRQGPQLCEEGSGN